MTHPDSKPYPTYGTALDQQWSARNPGDQDRLDRERTELELKYRRTPTAAEIAERERYLADLGARQQAEAKATGQDSWIGRMETASHQRDQDADERSEALLAEQREERRQRMEAALEAADRRTFRDEISEAVNRRPRNAA